jgi:hypothetical protein
MTAALDILSGSTANENHCAKLVLAQGNVSNAQKSRKMRLDIKKSTGMWGLEKTDGCLALISKDLQLQTCCDSEAA